MDQASRGELTFAAAARPGAVFKFRDDEDEDGQSTCASGGSGSEGGYSGDEAVTTPPSGRRPSDPKQVSVGSMYSMMPRFLSALACNRRRPGSGVCDGAS